MYLVSVGLVYLQVMKNSVEKWGYYYPCTTRHQAEFQESILLKFSLNLMPH